jgi:phage terminase small subunit
LRRRERKESPLFIAEYLIDLNATKAAIRAGYRARTAAEIGRQNLRKLEIAAAIEKAIGGRAERAELTADWVVDELRSQRACRCARSATIWSLWR